MRTWIWIALLLAVSFFAYAGGAASGYFAGSLVAGSGTAGESYDVTPDDEVSLRARTYRFSPSTLDVALGKLTELVITNDDDTFHTFTYSAGGETYDHGLPAGETTRVLVKFDDAQTISFHCKPHDSMRGDIDITEA